MSRLIGLARTVLHGSAVLLFIAMVSLVLAQVVARKFFEPLVWSEELARYLFIWVSFIGWVIATERRTHVAIGFVGERASPATARVLGVFTDAATLVLMALLIYYGVRIVDNNRDVETVTLFFSYALVYAAVPVAALAIAAITLARLSSQRRATP